MKYDYVKIQQDLYECFLKTFFECPESLKDLSWFCKNRAKESITRNPMEVDGEWV